MSTPAARALDNLTPAQKRELLNRLAGVGALPAVGTDAGPRVERREGVRELPLSSAQERLWFLDRFAPGSAFYNQNLALRLQVRLERARFERVLNAVIARHEVLRTTFAVVDGQPVQRVAAELQIAVGHHDLTGLPADEREARVHALALEEARTPFDLERGPLIRASILNLAASEVVLLLTLHHIVSDGWSLGVLFREINAIAESHDGSAPPLEPLSLQYGDYVLWQREWLRGPGLAEQLAWWRAQLADLPLLALPLDRPRPRVPTFSGALHPIEVPERVTASLRALAQREGATLFMALLAAFQAVLARYAGQEDIVVGVPAATRSRAELEPLIGFFVNTLVMRLDLSGDPSFRTLVGRAREAALGAYAHQEVPFEKLVQELHPERDTSRNPLFQVTFQLFTAPVGAGALTDPVLTPVMVQRGTSNVDLACDLYDLGPRLAGAIEYSVDLFDAATISRLSQHFLRLLEGVVAQPDVPLSHITLLDRHERTLVVDTWNRTTKPVLGGVRIDAASVCDLIWNRCARTPGSPALRFEGTSTDYGTLARRMDALASVLVRRGVGPGDRVAVLMERSANLVVAVLAVLRASGVCVPLDPAWPAARVQHVLEDADVTLILADPAARSERGVVAGDPRTVLVESEPPSAGAGDAPFATAECDQPGSSSPDALPIVSPGQIACLLYTSGSTAVPKGIPLTHRGLVNQIGWMLETCGLGPDDRTLLKYSIGFDAAMLEVLLPLAAGSTLVVARPGGQWDPAYLGDLIERERVTLLDAVPSQLASLLEHGGLAKCRSLRHVVCGGEVLPPPLLHRLLDALPVTVHNMYGPCEATITSTSWCCARHDGFSTDRPSVPIGRPIANMRAYVLDRHLEPVPIGVPGELCLAGAGVAAGYWRRPELTADAFVPNPFATPSDDESAGWLYCTGDRVRWSADGELEFLGRLDDQIKLRGFRIEPVEIERQLEACPDVREALVLVEQVGCDKAGQFAREPDAEARETNPEAAEPGVLLSALAMLDEREADALLRDVEGWSAREAHHLLERGPVMMRSQPEFDVLLKLRDREFIPAPRESQRHWLLQRALDELADDLRALDRSARRFVPGTDRPFMTDGVERSRARYDRTQLIVDGQQVMQAWERPLMTSMAEIAAASHGDVLEVGFGMGLSATALQQQGVRSHTIIECNDDVISAFNAWRAGFADRDIRLVRGRWQDVAADLSRFDAILFDTYPLDEEEFVRAVLDGVTFAEPFVPVAAAHLRPGGVFTYYSNEIDSLSRRHQRLLLSHFREISIGVVRRLAPPQDCHYWWADSMAVVRATA